MVGTRKGLWVAGVFLALSSALANGAAPDTAWAATWQASPEAPRAPLATLNNQTVRQVVRVSLGGNRFRVRLSNEYNDNPLRIGAAHVALPAKDGAIQLGSDRALTFSGGRREVVIPAHSYVYSDAVEISVSGGGQMSVSLYVPGNEKVVTEHFFALQTGWVASRDVTGATTLTGATTITKRLLLTGIDVVPARKGKVVVALGDALTGGFGSTADANHRWTDYLADRLAARKASTSIVNAGIGGNRLLHDFIGPNAVSRFDRDVLGQSGVTHVIVLIGSNDFGLPGGRKLPQEEVTLEEMVAGFRQLIVRAHVRGVKVIAGTLPPFGPIPERPGYYSEQSAAKRVALNQWIRTGKEFDGVIDFEAALRDPKNPKSLLAAYDSGDHLDPNDAGYKAMADAVDLKLIE